MGAAGQLGLDLERIGDVQADFFSSGTLRGDVPSHMSPDGWYSLQELDVVWGQEEPEAAERG